MQSFEERHANHVPDLTCCQFHPDGHLLAAGSTGAIKILETKTCSNAATFITNGTVQSLAFSENGTWLAAVTKGSSSVGIWDLRKAAEIKTLDFGSRIDYVRWDYTGQYLVGAGSGCVAVQAYDKGSKSWSEPLRKACSATAAEFGPNAKSLVVLNVNGTIAVLR
jgi:pre-mRNA-processing factor 19